MKRYPFIAIEGLDGTGKTTVRKGLFRLWDSLYAVTPLCILTTNFLDSSVAAQIIDGKYSPTPQNAETYLGAVVKDKTATLKRLVDPALSMRPVIADRWLLSELAFFAVKHARPPRETYDLIGPLISRPLDATIFLDLPTETSVTRSHARPGDSARADWDVLDVQQRVRGTYDEVIASPEDFPLMGQILHIDASSDPATVLGRVWNALREADLMPRSDAPAAEVTL